MALVTGFTAERMLEIENETVVSGLVGLDGHLLLYTREGTEIDAGNVKGEDGSDATVPYATTSIEGKLKLATIEETKAGIVPNKAVTPEGLWATRWDLLDLVAGPPAGVVDVEDTSIILTGFGALEDRTIYGVVDIIDLSGDYQQVGALGFSSSLGRITLNTASSGTSAFAPRFDTVSGSSNVTIPIAGSRVAGKRTVLWAQTRSGMTDSAVGVDTVAGTSKILTAGSGMETDPTLKLGPIVASQIPLAVIAYKGEHNASTRRRVMTWLAYRYGTLPPA